MDRLLECHLRRGIGSYSRTRPTAKISRIFGCSWLNHDANFGNLCFVPLAIWLLIELNRFTVDAAHRIIT
jgi:hypothetical protein